MMSLSCKVDVDDDTKSMEKRFKNLLNLIMQVTDEIASPFQIFLNFDLRTLAEQITLSDFEVYKNIRVSFGVQI